MTSVNSVRIPGLATGMDTDAVIKDMLAGEQNKIDRAKQKEQITKWQQEIYRDTIKDIQGFYDKYLTVTSPDYIMGSKAWNTLSVNSSNSSVITATGNAGANKVDYNFEVEKLAQPAKISKEISDKNTTLENLGITDDINFKISLGADKESSTITLTKDDTVESMIKKINDATSGEIKASYSDMTGKLTIETKSTGSNAKLEFINIDKDGNETKVEAATGTKSKIVVSSKDGSFTKTINEDYNTFTIDNVTYNVHSTGSSEITSKQDVKPVVDNMKAFIEDYNKIMDKMYDLVTEKKNADYPPLTDAQREEMSEDEIKKWEEKAKVGILRNDSEMRRFIDDMNKAVFGDNQELLNSLGITSSKNFNEKGQLYLDEEKFTKALETNGDKVYDALAKNSNSMLENMKKTIYNYTGSSNSIFAKKAGLEKSASATNNLYSNQLKRQEEMIKNLQRKMKEKEEQLYKKFAALESSMSKFNSQMNYLMS